MFRRSLLILSLDVILVLLLGLWIRGKDVGLGDGVIWGMIGGLICALSAIGAAAWAEKKRLSVHQSLAVVVVGMLFRMIFLVGWTLLAVVVGEAHAVAFIGGFGAVYLVGQVLEVWMLARLAKPSAPSEENAGPIAQ